MHAIPECLRGLFTTRHYTNPRSPLPYLQNGFVFHACSWLEGYGSPPRGHNGTIDSHGRLTFSVGDPKQLVREQLPDLLRLSSDCPFEDVRERCAGILLDLKV